MEHSSSKKMHKFAAEDKGFEPDQNAQRIARDSKTAPRRETKLTRADLEPPNVLDRIARLLPLLSEHGRRYLLEQAERAAMEFPAPVPSTANGGNPP